MPTSIKSSTIQISLLIIVSLALAWFVLKPQWNNYSQINADLKVARDQQSQIKNSLASLQSFIDSYTSHSKDVATASLALPLQDADTAGLVISVGDLAKSSGVVLSNLQITEPAAEIKGAAQNAIHAQKITFTVAGSYASFKDFILRLETHLRLVDVTHLIARQDDENQMQYQMDLTTYYQK